MVIKGKADTLEANRGTIQTCQYCGKKGRCLTMDHVKPRIQGGKQTWDNIVSACSNCNHKKAGQPPSQARMLLLKKP